MVKSLRELRREAKQKGVTIKTEKTVLGWDYYLLDKHGECIWGDGSARFADRQYVEDTLVGIDDWRTRISV